MQKTLFPEPASPAEKTCETLYEMAARIINQKKRVLRVPLRFASRGQRCRLFGGHGPWGFVIERSASAGTTVTIAEFDAIEVLQATSEKLNYGR